MAVWIALGAVVMGVILMGIAIYAAVLKKNKDNGDAGR